MCGITIEQFWGYTLKEISFIFSSFKKNQDQILELGIWHSYNIGYLSKVKKFPKFKDFRNSLLPNNSEIDPEKLKQKALAFHKTLGK